MLYFHYCKTYRNVVSQEVHTSVTKVLNEFADRDSLKGVGKMSSFTGGVYVLLINKPYTEIILQESKIKINNIDITVFFVRGIKTKMQDYIEIRDGKWLTYNPLSDEDSGEFVLNFEILQDTKPPKPEPPDDLLAWQNSYKLRVDYDIYETESWIKFAMSNSNDKGMKDNETKLFRLTILELVKSKTDSITNLMDTRKNEQILSTQLNECGIVYSKILLDNNFYFLLHSGANTKTQNDYWNEINNPNYVPIKNYESLRDICSNSLKAYPHWALNDPDLWVKIEKNNEMGNLSLLPEQTEFLKEFKFPKYINGQAGSGKSTMLYYLFANAYYYKYAGEIKGDIIFLTENEKLLKHTTQSVFDLLLNNPEFDLSSEEIAITNLKKHFYSFKNFLLSLIPDDNNDFKPDKYLNFSKFKLLYEQSTIAKHIINKYSAELVWFTISTYVYGYDLDYQIMSGNYEEKMPTKGKEVISLDDLKSIEREVIHPFYNKKLQEGYWDKIKLIRYLSQNSVIKRQYEIIFCDEAQDFSRVELEFILKLSIYTNYKLNNVEQFPIVFAGDALQTVNPTGFRSEVLTSMLFEKLTDEDIGFNLLSQDLAFTPTYNYRSSQAIVNLANAIQYKRKNDLGAEIKNPQISKRLVLFENEHLNVFVDFNQIDEDIDLLNKIEYKTIIVPYNNDEIQDIKNINPFLNRFNNVISAVDAKGIDFSEVIIYGFGDFFLKSFLGRYEERFFFNKLYVAITRAQAELVIIDSYDSKNNFWVPIITDYLVSDWKPHLETNLVNFEDIIIFDSSTIIQSKSDVVENDAIRQKNQGIIDKNIPLLKIASNHFIKIDNKKEYYLCLGIIEEINNNWKKAAEFFLKKEVGQDGIERAIIVYWNSQSWIEIKDLNKKIKNEKLHVIGIIADLFINEKLLMNDLINLDTHVKILEKLLNSHSSRKEIINALLLFLDIADSTEAVITIQILENISYSTDKNVWELIGKKYFMLNKFESAISALKFINDEGMYYLMSKLEIAKKANNLEDIIIWHGRIAIETDVDKSQIGNEIIRIYKKDLLNKDVVNEYVLLYTYISFIVCDSNYEGLLDLAKIVESKFKLKKTELADKYLRILSANKYDMRLFEYLLDRWAKNSYDSKIQIEEINETYKSLSQTFGYSYFPFDKTEIEKISSIPSYIIKNLPDHIKNIKIGSFRKFENILIENLDLFNLVVGDNNLGKTSLLEALLFTPNKKEYIERLALAYVERSNTYPDKKADSEDINLYYNLSKEFMLDFKNADSKDNFISFQFYNSRNNWNYSINLDMEYLNNSFFDKNDFEHIKDMDYFSIFKQPYISYGKSLNKTLAQIYHDEIGTKRIIEHEFLDRMKTFIPNIERIIADTKTGRIEIRASNFVEDIPLYQYGEGAGKLFRILLLLTLHKGKKLLIDEIDAGIHFSRFKSFWKTILEVAKKDNTQIIVTTHNDECIKYFVDVLNDLGENYQKLSRVIQLKTVKNLKIHSFEYSGFSLATESGIELRGN